MTTSTTFTQMINSIKKNPLGLPCFSSLTQKHILDSMCPVDRDHIYAKLASVINQNGLNTSIPEESDFASIDYTNYKDNLFTPLLKQLLDPNPILDLVTIEISLNDFMDVLDGRIIKGRNIIKFVPDLVKITVGESEIRNKFKYCTGPNIDCNDFDTTDVNNPFGLYFTPLEYAWMQQAYYIYDAYTSAQKYFARRVTLDPDEDVVVYYNRFKANKIILGERKLLPNNIIDAEKKMFEWFNHKEVGLY